MGDGGAVSILVDGLPGSILLCCRLMMDISNSKPGDSWYQVTNRLIVAPSGHPGFFLSFYV